MVHCFTQQARRNHHTPDSTVDNLGGGGAAFLPSGVASSALKVSGAMTDTSASALGAAAVLEVEVSVVGEAGSCLEPSSTHGGQD